MPACRSCRTSRWPAPCTTRREVDNTFGELVEPVATVLRAVRQVLGEQTR